MTDDVCDDSECEGCKLMPTLPHRHETEWSVGWDLLPEAIDVIHGIRGADHRIQLELWGLGVADVSRDL